jgi:hypothetical protein
MALKIKLPLILLLFLVFLISCSKDSDTNSNTGSESAPTPIISEKEASFVKVFSEEMNTKIKFLPPQKIFKIGECPYLGLENLSDKKIIFPSDFGLKIMTYTDNEWRYIKNTAEYVPPGNRQVSPKEPDIPGIIAISLCPDLPDFQTPIELRVVITGETESANNTVGSSVGAFVDILIEK